ncbi:DUF6782 family putative metallopeptidase [Aliiruegeria lutimaris]|uniref:DUF6782 domain-containing protein n=1 Tax=Aliiruegeria lutimaris TaxID=571298 RepID=A0A1G8UY73_9RHOB|nr:DUF6782 family putative metallopeptidase [Aliiruegeria lutimaris]SDJ58045.1 hypothetical protein SAMN04488026_10207 [Aliiruegeria lutimaris]
MLASEAYAMPSVPRTEIFDLHEILGGALSRTNSTFAVIGAIKALAQGLRFVALAMASCAMLAAQGANGQEVECLSYPYDQAESVRDSRIRELLLWLRVSVDQSSDLLRALDTVRPEICLADYVFGAEGFFDVYDGKIVIDGTLSKGMMQAVLIHELRHIHQVRIGVCPGPMLSMHETARVTLAMEADASAVSLQLAWDLKQSGNPDTWNALAAWPTHSDIADAFEKEMDASENVARATAQAFAQWYISDWRREEYYLAACSDYLDIQDATHALPKYGLASPEMFDRICTLPTGENYNCVIPTELNPW